jgi:guanine nucleotide-binding protein G(I)/G(S)/G(T) subunit beta-1
MSQEKVDKLKSEIAGMQGQADKQAKDLVSGLPAMPTVQLRRTIKGHVRKAYYVSWSADSVHVASAGQEGFIMVTNATNGMKKCAPIKCAFPHTAAVNPSCTLVAGGGMDNKITVTKIDEATPTMVKEIADGHDGYISRCVWLEDKKLLTASGDGTTVIWDANGYKKIQGNGAMTFVGHEMDVGDVSVPLDNKKVFATCGNDKTVRVWDITSGKCTRIFQGPDGFNACAMFPNGGAVAAGCEDGSLHFFDVGSGTSVGSTSEKKGKSVQAMTFSASGRALYYGTEAGKFMMCDPFNFSEQKEIAGAAVDGKAICAVDVAPDGSALATSSYDTMVKIWTGP